MNNKPKLLAVWTGASVPSYQYWLHELAKYYQIDCLAPKKWVHGSTTFITKDQNLDFKLIISLFWPYLSSHFLVPRYFLLLLKKKYEFLFFINDIDRVNSAIHLAYCSLLSPKTKKVAYSLQNLEKPNYYRWYHKLSLKLNGKILQGILCASEEIKDVINKHGIFQPQSIQPLGVSPDFFRAGDKISLRNKYKIAENTTAIVYAGSLHPAKGIQYLIENITFFENLTLILAGSGPLEKTIKQGSNIKYLGQLPQEKLLEIYQLSDYIVLPSIGNERWKEQIGRVLLEGILCGCLAIGSNSGYIPTIVNSEEAIFNPESPDNLKKFLGSLPLERHREIQTMQYNNVRENYSWEKIAKDSFNFFSSL